MNALQSVVSSLATKETKERENALTIYRDAVHALAENKELDSKNQLEAALKVLELSAADLEADVSAIREHAQLSASVKDVEAVSAEYSAAVEAEKKFLYEELHALKLKFRQRIVTAEYRSRLLVQQQIRLRALVHGNPRVFAPPAVAAPPKPAPAPAKPPKAPRNKGALLGKPFNVEGIEVYIPG